MNDEQHMRQALALAEQGLGQSWPNPTVGCVIVRDGRVVGLGRTQRGGRPHAETEALAMAGDEARGATVYVSLEPCAHQGQTGPCAEALIAAGVARVVAATFDPNPQVEGKGFARLRQAGIAVTSGVLQHEAIDLNKGFISQIRWKRPWVTLKTASSMDGFIADAQGRSKWITTPQSREHVLGLRREYDVILTGVGTVLADDPQLNCRLPGQKDRSPVRVVLEGERTMPMQAQMLGDGGNDVWIIRSPKEGHLRLRKYHADARDGAEPTMFYEGFCDSNPTYREYDGRKQRDGFELADGHEGPRRVNLMHVLQKLGSKGVTRVLVEAGSAISGAFWQAGLVDELVWYRAPIVIGQGGLPALGMTTGVDLDKLARGRILHGESLGGVDLLSITRFTEPESLLES